MQSRSGPPKDAFMALAAQLGFDPADPHTEALYAEVCLRASFADALRPLDLEGVDPIVLPPRPEATR